MAWSFVGVSSVVEATTTAHTLTEPAGCAAGDLLVAIFSVRTTDVNSITLPTGWKRVTEQKNNSASATTAALASGMMAYIVRGSSAPALTFTHPSAPNVAQGQIVAYRGGHQTSPVDVKGSATTATNTTAVSVTGVTTVTDGSLIVVGACGGQEGNWSAFNATSPSGASGATSSAAPTTSWLERADTVTTTGADTSLGIADAIKTTAGATGNITVTCSQAAGHAVLIGAFRILGGIVPPISFGDLLGTLKANNASIPNPFVAVGDGATVAVGDVIVAMVAEQTALTVTGATDNLGNIYIPQNGGDDIGNVTGRAFYSIVTTAGDLTSVSATTTASSDNAAIVVAAFGGPVSALDANPPNILTDATSPFDCPSTGTLGQADELVIGWCSGGGGAGLSATSPSTLSVSDVSSTVIQGAISHRLVAATTAVAPQFTGADQATVLGTMSFRKGTSPALDTITQVGSVLTFPIVSTANSGTVSSTITVPSDATFMTVGVSGVGASSGFFTGGTLTFTKGGVDTAMVWPGNAGDNVGGQWMAAIAYMVLPDTGTNKTLKYDWLGSGVTSDPNTLISVTFWKGVDTASPVRSFSGGQSTTNTPYTSGSITTASGDRTIAFVGANCGGPDGSVVTWSNLTELSELTNSGNADGTWATSTSTGTFTVAALTDVGLAAGAIVALVAKARALSLDIAFSLTEAPDVAAFEGDVPLSAITGTLAVTEGADTASFAGQAVISASLATTENADAASFAGFVGVSGSLAATDTPDTALFAGDAKIVAALAVTEAPDAAAFTGNAIIAAALAVTEANDSAAFVGDVVVAGGFALVEAQDIASFAAGGLATISGTLAATETTDSAAFVGGVLVSGALAATEARDAAAFAGSVLVSGSLVATEATDIALFAGGPVISAALAATEAKDSAAITGGVLVSGSLAATETKDSAAFSGQVVIAAALAAQETADSAAFNGFVGVSGSFALTEAKDVAAFAGDVRVSGSLVASEAKDAAAFAGSVIVSGALAATEVRDVAAFSGSVVVSGALIATEATDAASFAGNIVTGVSAVLAATETRDAAAFAGDVKVAGALVATEDRDSAAFAGQTGILAALAATDNADAISFHGTVFDLISGTFAVAEAPDLAAFSIFDGPAITGFLAASEANDAAKFTAQLISDVPGVLTYGHKRVVVSHRW